MKNILFAVLVLLSLSSCNHYESKVSIGSPNTTINSNLLGEWILAEDHKDGEISGFIDVLAFNKSEYLVQLIEYADSSNYMESIINMRMFETKIRNSTYLNLQFLGDDNDKSYMIYRFKSISGNRYKLYYLSKELFQKEFHNSKEFEEYAKTHYKEFDKSFEVEGILSRKIK
ncbi:hypothetical protein [Ancylomarina longa]|uniref:Uncharacterized protein n=1 Tax=Ancylomarina longa TaxID=2487017 RepID=A0A434AFK5_9BACT|nr:hypothetical protein [Ancylomarina longa]RUT73132.1 hypothetical protein DLK05_14715 [Ancylomarina longa]